MGADADLDEVFRGYPTLDEAAWRCFPDVESALATLARRRVPTVVLTNGTEEQQRAKVVATGLAGRVGPLLTAEGIGTAKPDRRAYLLACEALSVEPALVLHVGDDHALDVVAARRAGLGAVHLDRSGGRLDSARIRSLRELPALLLGDPAP